MGLSAQDHGILRPELGYQNLVFQVDYVFFVHLIEL